MANLGGRDAGWTHAAVHRCAAGASGGGAASGPGGRGHERAGQGEGGEGEGMLGAQAMFVFLAGGGSTAADRQRAVEGWLIMRLSTDENRAG